MPRRSGSLTWIQLVALFAVGILSASPAFAATLCVNPGGTGGCFASVQAAVDAAVDGDEIEIAAGTYTGTVTVPAMRLSFRGAGVEATTISGGPDVALDVEEGARVDARGMTLVTLGADGGAAVTVGSIRRTTLRLEDCRVIGDAGIGGRAIVAGPRGRVELRRCTVSGAGGTGVSIDIRGFLRMESVTIQGNPTGLAAGGARVLIRNSTIADSSVEAIFASSYKKKTRMTIRSSTIQGGVHAIFNLGGRIRTGSSIIEGACYPPAPDASGIASLGGNLLSECVPSSGRVDLDLLGADPLLGPLQDNGGPTPTMLPGVGSPAIDALDKMRFCGQPDQRGNPRGLPCDIGAVDTP